MRLLLAAGWILIGAAVTAGVYWAFLITPESTVWALALSALLALLALALVGLTANGAIALWTNGASIAGIRRAARQIPAIVPAALLVWLSWWIAGRIDTWVAIRSGGTNAWFIARFGWDDMTWLFTAVRWFTAWLRWVLSALLALSLMAGVAAVGWRGAAQAAWVRRALRPRAILLATVWFVALIVLPWTYLVPWRPQWLPPTSAEFTFIVVKLSISAILIAIGAALIVYEAMRLPTTPTDPDAARLAA